MGYKDPYQKPNIGSGAMDRRQMALKLVVEGLGLEFKITFFQDRLILQKAVYLSQAAGLGLGYHFQWYLRGPYSPALTRDAYSVGVQLAADDDESEGWVLDDHSVNRLGDIRSLFQNGGRPRLADKLELLASVHFLIDHKQVPEGDVRAIQETLTRYEKNFGDDEIRQALGELKKNALLVRSR